jgi:two-component system sensor histidine kinase CiaH
VVVFEKRLQLDYKIEPDLLVHGSSEQIKQVVLILMDNALKYTNPNGSITISLKTQHHDADASRSRQQGGYGLGLAIAKSIVEQHKGKLYAKSTVGQTTSFYLHLEREESQ